MNLVAVDLGGTELAIYNGRIIDFLSLSRLIVLFARFIYLGQFVNAEQPEVGNTVIRNGPQLDRARLDFLINRQSCDESVRTLGLYFLDATHGSREVKVGYRAQVLPLELNLNL